jgi:nicotinate-nucleotide adenylyltransferase
MSDKPKSRIGIYAGTFNPVHSGHVAFALQAIQAAHVDMVYFLPERQPRGKQHVEHLGHRVGMLERALQPHPQLKILELADVNFSVKRTLPQLQQQFKRSQLVFLFGSDIVPGLADWPHAARLLQESELVIGIRSRDNRETIRTVIERWRTQPKSVTIFDSYAPDVSSGIVRDALRKGQAAIPGLLTSVERYSDRHWLYVSITTPTRAAHRR